MHACGRTDLNEHHGSTRSQRDREIEEEEEASESRTGGTELMVDGHERLK